jgi:hypothetical protein
MIPWNILNRMTDIHVIILICPNILNCVFLVSHVLGFLRFRKPTSAEEKHMDELLDMSALLMSETLNNMNVGNSSLSFDL